jgi:hypothetical protein
MKKETPVKVDISWFAQNVNGEYKYTRKMYPQHKNMQSGGFSLGDDSIAMKYLNRPSFRMDYKEELLSKLQAGKLSDHRSFPLIKAAGSSVSKALPTQPSPRSYFPEESRPEPPRDLSPLAPRDFSPRPIAPLARPTQKPFEDVLMKRKESPFRTAGAQTLAKKPDDRARSVSPFGVGKAGGRDISPIRLQNMTPVARNESGKMVHELASHPLFQAPKFTKRNPKQHFDNPITGLPPDYQASKPVLI